MNRRDFLKILAGTVAVAATKPWKLLDTAAPSPASLKYKGVPVVWDNTPAADMRRMYEHVYKDIGPRANVMLMDRHTLDAYCEAAGVEPEDILEEKPNDAVVLDMRSPAQRKGGLAGLDLRPSSGLGWDLALRSTA